MPSVTLFPGTVATASAGSPGVDWTNPNNIKADDGSIATSDLSAGDTSYYAQCTNFNFGAHIPAGATPVGIQATVKKDATSDGSVAHHITDFVVRLVLTGAFVGANKADTMTVWPGSLTNVLYGGSADLWSWSPALANITDSSFGIWVSCQNPVSASPGPGTAGLDAISLTVWWTGGTLNPPILSGGQLTQYGIRTGGRLYRHPCYSFPARIPGPNLRRAQRWQTLVSRA